MAKKRENYNRLKKILADKVNILSLVCFILSLFLLDVSANNIAAYGIAVTEGFYRGTEVRATSTFWFGFIGAAFFFALVAIRSMYVRRKYPSKLDLFFGIFGVIGLMIILSGGILMFWHGNSLLIPFFSFDITRITYYHTGIGIELIAMFYFALTH